MLPSFLPACLPARLQGICSTHSMDGCNECTPWEGPDADSYTNCAEPLPILAYMCYGEWAIRRSCSGAACGAAAGRGGGQTR